MKKAIQDSPDSGISYAELGYAYANLRKFDKALLYYDMAIQLEYHHYLVYYNRGWAKYNLDKNSNYCADFQMALDLGYRKAQYTLDEECR